MSPIDIALTTINVLGLVKVVILVFEILYVILSIIVIRQMSSLHESLTTPLGIIFKIFAKLQFLVSLALIVLTLLIL